MRTSRRPARLCRRIVTSDEQCLVWLHLTAIIPLLTFAVSRRIDLHVLALGRGGVLRRSILWRLQDSDGQQVVVGDGARVAHGQRVPLDARDWSPEVDDAPAAVVLKYMAA